MKLLVVPLILLLLNTCGNSNEMNRAELNREFELKFHESVFVKSEKITIRFSSLIEDSRCPSDVQCVQAGKAVIAVEVAKGKQRSTVLQLSTDEGANEMTHKKFKIKLVELQPYPMTSVEKDPARYTATLLISRVQGS